MKQKKALLIILVAALVLTQAIPALAYTYNIVFDGVPPATVNWGCPLPTWATVTSKWNQPRDTGTNPHRGVDLAATVGTRVNAVYDGWLNAQIGSNSSGIDTTFQLDINSDGVKNDSAVFCNYYHLNTKGANAYYRKGEQVGTSGYPSAPHLHYGATSANSYSALWYRNEVNYRWTSNWNYGKDLDSFSVVTWSNNVAGATIYFCSSGTKSAPQEVRIFHRKAGTATWTDGGTMTAGSNYLYTYNFTGKYPAGTSVQWMIRFKRNIPVYSYAFAPAKFDQPDPNPNSTAYAYAYVTNTIQ